MARKEGIDWGLTRRCSQECSAHEDEALFAGRFFFGGETVKEDAADVESRVWIRSKHSAELAMVAPDSRQSVTTRR